MRRNSKIHFWIETEAKQVIKQKAQEEGLSVSEYCRDLIRDDLRLLKLEIMMRKVIFILENRKIYKEARSNNYNQRHEIKTVS